MTAPDDFFDGLRRDYVSEAPQRIAELREDLRGARTGSPEAVRSLRTRFHRLAGSGGSYGFPEISELARRAERLLMEEGEPAAADVDRLAELVERLSRSFAAAAESLEPPR